MKDILHLKNVFYSKKDGFIFNTNVKDVDLYIEKYKIDKHATFNKTINSPMVVIDTIHSCFVHGIVDSIFSLHWMIQEIKETNEEIDGGFKVFVRERDVLKYAEQNLKNIDEEEGVFKGVYGELMNLCTNKKIMFEHLIKEDEIYLIPDVFFSKLNTKNQRSLWNSELYYPGRCKDVPIFTDVCIQRRWNLFKEEVLNYYNVDKTEEPFNKTIILVDRKTKYRSLANTWLHSEDNEVDPEKDKTLCDKLNYILTKQGELKYNGVVYLEDLSMKEQIEVFRNNSIIVTPHGANMVHSLWCSNKIIVEVLYEKEKACMYNRFMKFTNKNRLAQLSPYDIEQFIMLLIFRFKPKDRLNKIEEVEEDEIEISETS